MPKANIVKRSNNLKQKLSLKSIANDVKPKILERRKDSNGHKRITRKYMSVKELPIITKANKTSENNYKEHNHYLPIYNSELPIPNKEQPINNYYNDLKIHMLNYVQRKEFINIKEEVLSVDNKLLGRVDLLGKFSIDISSKYHNSNETVYKYYKVTRKAHDKFISNTIAAYKIVINLLLNTIYNTRQNKKLHEWSLEEVYKKTRVEELSMYKDDTMLDVEYNIYNYPYFLIN